VDSRIIRISGIIRKRPLRLSRFLAKESVKSLKAYTVSIDLREWCSLHRGSRALGSCTAHAGAGIIEYYERKSFWQDILRLATLSLLKSPEIWWRWRGHRAYYEKPWGDGALGVPPEEYWIIGWQEKFDEEPPAFCYALHNNYQTIILQTRPPGTKPKRSLIE